MTPLFHLVHAVGSAAPASAPLPKRIRHHYLYSFQDPRRERLFLSSLGFDLGAISARTITHLIRRGVGPFHNLSANGRHLHHLVFGIAGLLGTGYLWLGIADTPDERLAACLEALVRHLHAAVRELRPTVSEWEAVVDFLTRTGQKCDDTRQEFVLLSDVLGISSLVETLSRGDRIKLVGELDESLLGVRAKPAGRVAHAVAS